MSSLEFKYKVRRGDEVSEANIEGYYLYISDAEWEAIKKEIEWQKIAEEYLN